jgi:hypothetical protein
MLQSFGVPFYVGGGSFEQVRVVLEVANSTIAIHAEQAAHSFRLVAMINGQPSP